MIPSKLALALFGSLIVSVPAGAENTEEWVRLGARVDGGHHRDSQAVTTTLMATFDRPDARLKVEPVIVDGDVAIAGWAQDGRGGRALLRRVSGHWKIILCAGEALKQKNGMIAAGIEPIQAGRMAATVLAAESMLAPATVALLDSFEGTMMMGADGTHPPTHGHGSTPSHGHQRSH